MNIITNEHLNNIHKSARTCIEDLDILLDGLKSKLSTPPPTPPPTPTQNPKINRIIEATHEPNLEAVHRFQANTWEDGVYTKIIDVYVNPENGGKYVILQYENESTRKYKVYFDYKNREEYYQIKNKFHKLGDVESQYWDKYHASMYEERDEE